jgi:hypothetical protein
MLPAYERRSSAVARAPQPCGPVLRSVGQGKGEALRGHDAFGEFISGPLRHAQGKPLADLRRDRRLQRAGAVTYLSTFCQLT